ncbi:MAG: Hsp33 family molecular chaperone HslO [Proteobacteria bacterium]|nr:Hsp33 family molecular chaperone HslO [Pseudomonadota bacterium]
MDKPLALYRRFLWESKNISWIYTASTDLLLASRKLYFESCGMAQHLLTEAQQREVDDLIIAATLASESQVDRDSWGWTIRIPLKPWGIFCAVEPEGMVCARFSNLDPAASQDPIGMFAVQRVSENSPVRQTSLIPRDVSTRYLVEQYFDESEQLPAKIAISGNEALMALSMPNAEWDIVKGLQDKDLLSLFHELMRESDIPEKPAQDENLSEKARLIKEKFAEARGEAIGSMLGDLRLMHEAVYFYGCRCDIHHITQMVENLPKMQQEELWKGTDTLDIQCPRCGRTHVITKKK